jgi:hypothetical protein
MFDECARCVVSRASNRPSEKLPRCGVRNRRGGLASARPAVADPSQSICLEISRRAREARALGRHALATALGLAQPLEIEALSGVVVGSATLASDLMWARMIQQGGSNAIPILSVGDVCADDRRLVRVLLTRRCVYRPFWHAPLAHFALFVCLFCGGALAVANH